jgi:hypothetical protein
MQAHIERVPRIDRSQSLSGNDEQVRRTHIAGCTHEDVREAASMSVVEVCDPDPDCWSMYIGHDMQAEPEGKIGRDCLDKCGSTAVRVQDGKESAGEYCLGVDCYWSTGEVW